MAKFNFERECRTAYSECYTILSDDEPVGRVDIPQKAFMTILEPEE